jgi:hypothetical protein
MTRHIKHELETEISALSAAYSALPKDWKHTDEADHILAKRDTLYAKLRRLEKA